MGKDESNQNPEHDLSKDSEGDVRTLAQSALDEIAGSAFPWLKGKVTTIAINWLTSSLCAWFDIPDAEKPKDKEDIILEHLGEIENELAKISATLGEFGHHMDSVSITLTAIEDQVIQGQINEAVRLIEEHADSVRVQFKRYADALDMLRTAEATSQDKVDALYSLKSVFMSAKDVSESMLHIRSAAWATSIRVGNTLMDLFSPAIRQAIANYACDPNHFRVKTYPDNLSAEEWPITVYHYERILSHGAEIVESELDDKILPTFKYILGTLLQGLVVLEAANHVSQRFITKGELLQRKCETVEFAACFKSYMEKMYSTDYKMLIAENIKKYAKTLTKSCIPASHTIPAISGQLPGHVYGDAEVVPVTVEGWPNTAGEWVMWNWASREAVGAQPIPAQYGMALLLIDSPWEFGKRKYEIVQYFQAWRTYVPNYPPICRLYFTKKISSIPEYGSYFKDVTIEPRPLSCDRIAFISNWNLSVLTDRPSLDSNPHLVKGTGRK